MNKLTGYKNMVAVLVTSGVEVKAALDAAEVVIYGANKEVTKQPSNWVKNVENWDELESAIIGNRINPEYLNQGQFAARFKKTTHHVNKTLSLNGYIHKVSLDAKKMLSGNHNHAVTTYRITKKGKQFGVEFVHSRYADETPAGYRMMWSESLFTELSKAGVVV
jgi:hypothetical protein